MLTPHTPGASSVAVRLHPVALSKLGGGDVASAAGAGPHAKRMVLE